MNEKYLVINGGSSSLKFSLYSMPDKKEIVNGYIEKIGKDDGFWTLKTENGKVQKSGYVKDHLAAVNIMLEELLNNNFISSIEEIQGIGHRVLHGGEFYSDSVIIDDEVIKNINDLTPLGPLHHPGQLAGILAMQKLLPKAMQVAVFDTSFHQTIPDYNYMYPVPYEWYEKYGVRKYGFHGTSHKYLTNVMKEKLNKEDVNLIICHIGSGASISAIKDGACLDTTMGLTPLDGLMMCTRSGSIDPSIIERISECEGLTIDEITNILNKKSGLLGITGKNDFRDVDALMNQGDPKAKLAYKMVLKSIIGYIADYHCQLGGNVDAIIFSAGIGENQINVREDVVNAIGPVIGSKLDKEKNDNIAKFKQNQEGAITTSDSKIEVLVIPTDEEVMILTDTYNLIQNAKQKESFTNIKK